jgi:adenylylsulfate kinase-like enzyme
LAYSNADVGEPGRFVEVFISCQLETLKERDPKGLYEKALRGEIKNFTGISSPYEAPENPELIIDSTVTTPNSLVEIVMKKLLEAGIV